MPASNLQAEIAEANILNHLLQCELSAARTYRDVLAKIGSLSGLPSLRGFEEDHEASADTLRGKILYLGCTPAKDPGIWGKWAEGVASSDRVVGTIADLGALKQEEQQTADELRRALEEPSLETPSRELIEQELLPRVEYHLRVVSQLIGDGMVTSS